MIEYRVTDHERVANGWKVGGLISTIPPFNFKIIEDPELAVVAIKSIANSGLFACDVETTSLEWEMPDFEVFGLSVADQDNAVYILGDAVLDKRVLKALEEAINTQTSIWYNLPFDLHALEQYDVNYAWNGLAQDVFIMSRLNNRGDLPKDGGLKTTAYNYLDIDGIPTFKKLLGARKTIHEIPVLELGRYGAFDARVTYDLYHPIKTILENEIILGKNKKYNNLFEYYQGVHLRATQATFRMESNGMFINESRLREVDEQASEFAEKLGTFWEGATGTNKGSSQQKAYFFFDVQNHESKSKTPAGAPATDSTVLEALSQEGDVWAKIYAEMIAPANKIRTTYTLPTLDRISRAEKPWIHGSFVIPRARTGRTASASPNLQNIPSKGKWGKLMRECFSAPEGYLYLRGDYSQLELRCLAHFSRDPAWVELFNSGGDGHVLTAETIGITRDQAKVVNFGVNYGMTPKSLAANMRIWGVGNTTTAEAEIIMESYFTHFAHVKQWMERVIYFARKYGYIQTILGRKRWLPEINARNSYERGQAERKAVNTVIQGTAADIMHIGTIEAMKIVDRFNNKFPDTPALLANVVHDELGMYVPIHEHTELLRDMIGGALESAGTICGLSVPLIAEPDIGNNWLEVK